MTAKLISLPTQHLLVLLATCRWMNRRTGEIVQPVTTDQVQESYDNMAGEAGLGVRAVRDTLTDLETMGLVDTWVESRGSNGRVKHVKTPFEPTWIREAVDAFGAAHDEVDIRWERSD